MKEYKIRAVVTEDIESQYEIIEAGTIVEGYLNSWHLEGNYTMQIEMLCESGGVGSGICVVNAPIDINTIEIINK